MVGGFVFVASRATKGRRRDGGDVWIGNAPSDSSYDHSSSWSSTDLSAVPANDFSGGGGDFGGGGASGDWGGGDSGGDSGDDSGGGDSGGGDSGGGDGGGGDGGGGGGSD